MNVEFTGRISKIGELQNIKENFSKVDLVIDVTENNYTNSYPVQALNDKTDYALAHKVGDLVNVKCNLIPSKPFKSNGGKEIQFLNLNLWFIKGAEESKASGKKATPTIDANEEFSSFPDTGFPDVKDDDSSDLPF